MPDHINVNNLTGSGGRSADSIPHLIQRDAEDIGSLFTAGTVDSISANNIVPGSFDWVRVAKGSHEVLKDGGTVAFAEVGGGTTQGLVIKAALEKAGFKDVIIDNISKTLVTGVKR